MRPLPPPDYLAVLAAKRRTVNVALAEGGVLIVRRARLRLYAELTAVLEGEEDGIDRMVRYVELATGREADDFEAALLPETFAALLQLNEVSAPPAMMRAGGSGRALPAFQYRGRWLAALVATLVRAGFCEEYVLEQMDAGEAWLYLQEVVHADWEEYAQDYSLSDAGRDKRGHQKKLKPPDWARMGYDGPPGAREHQRLPERAVQGVVLNFRDPKVIAEIKARHADA